MRSLTRLLTLFCLFVAATAYAQTDSLRYVVRGVVTDSNGGRPLAFVSVTLPGTNYATVTNEEGSFTIKSDTPPRFVAFSLLGYQPTTVPADRDQMMRVSLNRGEFTLDPAQVMTGEPLAILREAISRIDRNSPRDPELFDCFYRETVQKRQRFIYISEAVMRMYKSPFRDIFVPDRIAVLKSRLLTSPRQTDTLAVKVSGGPTQAVDLDLVRNRGVILNDDDLELYRLELLDPAMIDNRRHIVIGFSPAREVEYALQNGQIFIDQETLAISRIDLSLDMSDPIKATRVMLVRKPADIRFNPREMSLLLNYKQENGLNRISYVRTVFRFTCNSRRRLLNTDFTAVAEMVVTNRRTGAEAVPIPRTEAFRSADNLADKTDLYADPDFWKDYNIIEPTESLENAINRLKRQ